jgi:hypothetical protein
MTDAQRRILQQARRWSKEVQKEPSPIGKRQAVRKNLDCLYLLLGTPPKTELERQS